MTVSEYLRSRGYQTCEYIAGNRDAYVNTGIVANPDDFTANIRYKVYDYQNYDTMMGARSSGGTTDYFYVARYDTDGLQSIIGASSGGKVVYSSDYHLNEGTEVTLSMDNGNGTVEFNGTEKDFTYEPSRVATVPIYLFCTNYGGTPNYFCHGEIYYAKLLSGGQVVREYYPCYDIATGEAGLFDLAGDTFFGSDGTGVFTKGTDCEIADEYSRLTEE